MSFSVNDEQKPSISSARRHGPYVVFANNISTYWVSPTLAPEDLAALTTIAGGEPMSIAEFDDTGMTSLNAGLATDASLRNFKKWEGLRAMWLSRSSVTDAGLAELEAADDLDLLYLRGTAVTDEGMKYFRGHSFYTLDLFGTQVTDRGMKRLAEAAGILYLNVEETGVTMAGVEVLLQSHPDASVQYPRSVDTLHLPGVE